MFDLSKVEVQSSTGSAVPLISDPNPGFSPPWEAVPLALNWVLTSGTRDENKYLPIALRTTEKVLRAGFYIVSTVVISYLIALGHMFKYSINFGKDWFALIMLMAWYLALVLLLFAQFVGRLRALPATLTAVEVGERAEFHLPALFFNYQPFGFERRAGYAAAFIVLFVLVGLNATWALLIYDSVSRLVGYDPYSTSFSLILIFFTVSHVITALALSVSYGDLRTAGSKAGAPLTAIETLRVSTVHAYIFTVIVILLPLQMVFPVYGLN
jgi:hypothetical protein